jgi:MYXO-CTERM domain-containing protein
MVRAQVWKCGRLVLAVVFFTSVARISSAQIGAGPYSSQGIPANSPSFVEWANQVTPNSLIRGPQNITSPSGPFATVGSAASAIGPADNNVVSLGDGGQITVQFAQPIENGPGTDFAVFENGFASGTAPQGFLELGFVDVSSDGVNFFRFPSVSLTQTTTQVGSFGLLDPTYLHDLAGGTLAGTPFDLQEMVGVSPLLDVNDIQYVRVTDVIGNINESLGAGTFSLDSKGNVVNDPYPTTGASSGFDFDAVGVINAVPEPAAWMLAAAGLAGLFVFRRRVS